MHCWPCFTIPVPAFRRRLTCALRKSGFEPPARVRIMGKGQKERYCPLWPETVALLKALLMRQPRGKQERIFVNRYGDPLGASAGPLQAAQLCDDSREANTSFKLQARFTAPIPALDGLSPLGFRSRHHRSSGRARTRPPGYDKPLRSIQFGDKA